MARQFVVIGAGRFGSSVAQTLSKRGHQVLVIDLDMEKVDAIKDYVTQSVNVDTTDEKAMKALGIENFDVAIVAIGGDMQSSILATLLLKEIGVNMVVAKAASKAHGEILSRVGADKIVFPERDMGVRLGNSLVCPTILDHIEVSHGYNIVEIKVPKRLLGKSLVEANVRHHFGINVIAIKRGDEINISPDAEEIMREGDVFIIIGKLEDIEKFRSVK